MSEERLEQFLREAGVAEETSDILEKYFNGDNLFSASEETADESGSEQKTTEMYVGESTAEEEHRPEATTSSSDDDSD